MFTYVYKFILKYEEPEEEKIVKSRMVPSTGVSVTMELGCATFLLHNCVYQPRSPPNPILEGFLWWLYHVDLTVNSFSSSSSLHRGYDLSWKFQASSWFNLSGD